MSYGGTLYTTKVVSCENRGDETRPTVLGDGNFYNYIYGEGWEEDVVTSPLYDGNVFYMPVL